VGKTNIVSRYAYDKFNIGSNTTIGIEFVSRVVVVEQEEVCLQIWDTAGQDRFRALNRSFYRNAKGAIVVFSVGDGHGFRNLKKWIVELKEHANENLVNLVLAIGHDSSWQQIRHQVA
jgi:Ras-related protein Rab-11A